VSNTADIVIGIMGLDILNSVQSYVAQMGHAFHDGIDMQDVLPDVSPEGPCFEIWNISYIIF
jgi:hypothetical protein